MKHIPYMHIKLKALRQLKRLTNAEVAEGIGICRAYYTQIEGGTREPSEDIVKKLMAFYDLKSPKELSVSRELIADLKATVSAADIREVIAALDTVRELSMKDSGDSGAK